MSTPPNRPAIYLITHVDNLAGILADGGLSSDFVIAARGGPAATIGMAGIKEARFRLPVRCHPGEVVANFVPFYFCPRSIMLYLLHMGNHPNLSYRGGQRPILHLEADLYEAVAWAQGAGRRWAFSLSNAGAAYAEFRDRLDQLSEIDWEAIDATDFRPPRIKEGKQAEFLVHRFFPWHLVRRIGVIAAGVRTQVMSLLGSAGAPRVEVIPSWYY